MSTHSIPAGFVKYALASIFIRKLTPAQGVILDERSDTLVGYGGWLDLFFRTLRARNISVHLPRMVIYIAEALPHGAREFIEGHFGVPVFSHYTAAE